MNPLRPLPSVRASSSTVRVDGEATPPPAVEALRLPDAPGGSHGSAGSLLLQTPAPGPLRALVPRPEAGTREFRIADAAQVLGAPGTTNGRDLLARVDATLTRLHDRVSDLRERTTAVAQAFAARPELLEPFRAARSIAKFMPDRVATKERELARILADPWQAARYDRAVAEGREPDLRAELASLRAELADANATLTQTARELAPLDVERLIEDHIAHSTELRAFSEGVEELLRTYAAAPEARRLVFEQNIIGRSRDLFEAGWDLRGRLCRELGLDTTSQRGVHALPLRIVSAAVESFGADAWPLVANAGIVERVTEVQRSLRGDWENMYRMRFGIVRDEQGSARSLTPESVETFNRYVSRYDHDFYWLGNEALTAPLEALAALPAGAAREAFVAQLRRHDVIPTLFERLVTRMSDGGGAVNTSGSSQFTGPARALETLLRDVPEIRDIVDAKRYSIRSEDDATLLPPTYSMREWLEVNAGSDAEGYVTGPFWNGDGVHKASNIVGLMRVATMVRAWPQVR